MVEGAGLRVRPQVGADSALRVGADGLALDPKAGLAYYCPMISRKLYSVNLALLEDRSKSDAEVEASVQDLGEKGVSDGLVTDADGVLYLTDVENNLVKRRQADGTFQTIMRFSKYFWVDSLAIQNGELYATGNELQRLPTFNKGVDRREKRNVVAKIKLGP
jgi:sugar lactone lactonase YvrE